MTGIIPLTVEECKAFAQKIRSQDQVPVSLPSMLYLFGYVGVGVRFEKETAYDEMFHTGVVDRTLDES